MSREIPVFVSLIVWLFSITGKDGVLTVRPSNYVVTKGNTITFTCRSNLSYPIWHDQTYIQTNMDWVVRHYCSNTNIQYYTVTKSEVDSTFTCDLTVKPTAPVFSKGLSTRFICEDFEVSKGQNPAEPDVGDKESGAVATVIVLGAPLKCEPKAKELFCTLEHSAYRPIGTSMAFPYMDIRLELKNPKGTVVSNKIAGYFDDKTVVTAALDGGKSFSTANPYICSASFERHCDPTKPEECVQKLTIVPPSAVECKYFDSNWATGTSPVVTAKPAEQPKATEKAIVAEQDKRTVQPRVIGMSKPTSKKSYIAIEDEEADEEDSVEERVAVIISNGTAIIRRPGSNAKLERDGIDAIAIVTCLLAAFLVH